MRQGDKTYAFDASSGTLPAIDSSSGKLLWRTKINLRKPVRSFQADGDSVHIEDRQGKRWTIESKSGKALSPPKTVR